MDTYEYTNSELEEMGISPECECRSTCQEIDERGDVYVVCEDCGASVQVGRRVAW